MSGGEESPTEPVRQATGEPVRQAAAEPVRQALAELLDLARALEELPLEEAEPAPPVPEWR